jgi:hypothetical protein
MNVGILLPTFREGAVDALGAARAASEQHLDGVFAYDHLWPMGHPERPSLAPFPVLSAVASQVDRLMVGPLVARVGLVATSVLVEQFRTLARVAPSRVIAALGTGDKLSTAENVAYGLDVRSAPERRELLRAAAGELGDFEIWIGAGAPDTNRLARELDVVLNLWAVSANDLLAHSADGPVSWAGNARDDLEVQLDELAAAHASWAVFSPASDVARLGAWRRAHFETK